MFENNVNTVEGSLEVFTNTADPIAINSFKEEKKIRLITPLAVVLSRPRSIARGPRFARRMPQFPFLPQIL